MRWLLWVLAAEFVGAGLWGLGAKVRPHHRSRRRSAGVDWWSPPTMVALGVMVGIATAHSETAGRLSTIPFFIALWLMNWRVARHAKAPWLRRAATLAVNPLMLIVHPIRYLREATELFGHPLRTRAEWKQWEKENDPEGASE